MKVVMIHGQGHKGVTYTMSHSVFENMKEEDQPFMTVSLKVDQDTKMGVVTDVKQALRQSYALNINYSATQRQ